MNIQDYIDEIAEIRLKLQQGMAEAEAQYKADKIAAGIASV